MRASLRARLFACGKALLRRDRKRSAELLGYRPGPGDSDITILYEQGEGDEAGEVQVLHESADEVRVKVLYTFFNGLRLLVAIPREIVATLQTPLGDRMVLDEAGNEVRRV